MLISSPNTTQVITSNLLQSLFQKGHESLLTLHQSHHLYLPAMLKHRMYLTVIEELSLKKQLTAAELCYLVISKAITEQNYLVDKAKLSEKHGQKWIQVVDKWLQLQENTNNSDTYIIERPVENQLQSLHRHFQHLNQRATQYEYFSQKQVPVYLIPTSWLSAFYDSTSLAPIPSIDSRSLLKPMKLIDTDLKLYHLNYEVIETARQNSHYKIVSPECWKFLYQKFGGIETKRFTTIQKQPTVQVHYRKLNISIIEERYFHATNVEVLVPRYTKFSQLTNRLKRLLIAYNLVPFATLKKSIQLIKINHLTQQQLIDLVQDDSIDLIEQSDDRFQLITEELDIEGAKIYEQSTLMVLNFVDEKSKASDLFNQVESIQTINIRDSCLKCGADEQVFLCICKSVHFCSVDCQKNHKEHAKQCQKIRKQQIQIAKLIKDYDITQKQFQLTDENILQHGKVGLENLRNTCYLNSALQCILRVDKLVKYFASNDHLKDLNVDNVLGSEGHLACSFAQLVKKYYSTTKRSISPIDVIRIIAKNPQFRGADHQDSQEFLNYFLDKIHQDLNKIKQKPYIEDIESDGRPDQVVSKQSWENYLKRNRSIVQELFAGQYRSQIRCPDCERISITFDPFMSVTLQFPKPQETMYIKGYLLTLQGQFLKVETELLPNTLTKDFLAKTFTQQVSAVTIKNKVVKKQWRQDVSVGKNFSDEGLILFYIKETNWKHEINLLFLDQGREVAAFNRRLYVKNVDTFGELKKVIYKRLRHPVEKALNKKFVTEEQYLQFCEQNDLIVFVTPKESALAMQFPYEDDEITLKVQFNPAIKFDEKPKLNLSTKSYTPAHEMTPKSLGSKTLSIPVMIENFCQPEKLTEDNMWYCSKCKDHKMADKIMRLYKLPEILILHLKRFNHKNTRFRNLIGVEKIESSVKLSECETINGEQYQLIGVVNHFGSMTFGHYTAYVKKDEWMKYDDESVKRCNVNGDSAYLLFYKRKPKNE